MIYTCKNGLDQFIGLYSIAKALRFELIPQGDTLKNINEKGVLSSDKERAAAYSKVKMIIDEYHKDFIERALADVNIGWNELADAIERYRKSKDDKSKRNLQKLQAAKRKEINALFKRQADFSHLFKEKLFSKLLPEFIKKKYPDNGEHEAIKSFDRFTTYFKGFHKNRENIYSPDEISTSIAYRLVHDNFPKFYANISAFNAIKTNTPHVLASAADELKELTSARPLEEWFSAQGFNLVLSQKGIDQYNTLIGGYTKESGKIKIRGINEFSNLYRQKNPETSMPKSVTQMAVLYKQILSDRSTVSFIPDAISTDEEILDTISSFTVIIEEADLFNRLRELLTIPEHFSFDRVYIAGKELENVSNRLFGDWSLLKGYLHDFKVRQDKLDLTKKKNLDYIEKWLKSDEFSLTTLDEAIKDAQANTNGENPAKIKDYFLLANKLLDEATQKKEAYISEIDNTLRQSQLKENPAATTLIKNYLDAIIEIVHHLKPLKVGGELEKESGFYEEFDSLMEKVSLAIPLYNKVRNYITQKPYREAKYKLNFENPKLADGWDQNKEYNNSAILLTKDGLFYLGIMNAKNKPKITGTQFKPDVECYQKMVYKFFKATTMIPKCSTQMKEVKEHFSTNESDYTLESNEFSKNLTISKEIFDLNNRPDNENKKFQDAYLKETGDSAGYRAALTQWITFCMNFLRSYNSTKDYDFSCISAPEKYKRLVDFYSEINQQLYKITFEYIPVEEIDNWVSEGKLFLFQIYNKDFSAKSTGKPNLHTLYWKYLFAQDNLQDVTFKLNGHAELFFREASVKDPFAHKVGEKLVNKTTKRGKPIPEDVYRKLYRYANTGDDSGLSKDAQSLLDDIVVKDVKHEIVKDRRYTQDKFLFHVPIKINFKADDRKNNINKDVRAYLRKNKKVNIIGIDRGERNLLYISVIDQKGNILMQKSFNTVGKTDFAVKLTQREKERDVARKSWNSIEVIKDLKEGYLSQVVHEIAKLMVECNAIVALEDLNFGFKRGRFKVERQVYQKFEKKLIEKLNYLVFKSIDSLQPGGVLRGYQLTDKFISFKDLGKQCGFLFYVPAAFTSKVDPSTGFINAFNLKNLTNMDKKRDFFNRFDTITYIPGEEDVFAFQFDYNNFQTLQTCAKTKWTVYTNGKRIVYDQKTKEYKNFSPTEELKALFERAGIHYADGRDVKQAIMQVEAAKSNAWFIDRLYYAFSKALQLRNSNANTGEDYILSPVKGPKGNFFHSAYNQDCIMPSDADANGAYHIALKGLYLLNQISANADENGMMDNRLLIIKNEDWLRYIQERDFMR